MANRVVFSDSEVAALTGLPKGQVYRYMVKSGRAIARDARENCPSRTGTLKRSISARITRANATSTRVRISASAPHAEWVHNGTDAVMTPLPKTMTLYGQVMVGKRSPASWVSKPPTMGAVGNFRETAGKRIIFREGQTANPFMARALVEWALENGFRAPTLR